MTKSPKFAFIKARWHADIVDQALAGFRARLAELGVDAEIDCFDVPGAFEMPLLAQRLAATGGYDAIAAAALVVDGGIYRHDFVAQAVVSGLMEAGLKTGVPVLSVSLTPHHFQPSAEHEAFFHDHFAKKGREAADAALQVTHLHDALPQVVASAAA
ncbi:MAG: 6,7-dimethyl-8-ribityllumazine synthase [Rhodobacteraceae bacterium]|nr:6,7-dimethyl-8-ribityllumazine synthase [Paracoccaceae bacterium]